MQDRTNHNDPRHRPFHVIDNWDLPSGALDALLHTDWNGLPITSQTDSLRFSRDTLTKYCRGQWSIHSCLWWYGALNKDVCVMTNRILPQQIHECLAESVHDCLPTAETPVIRLQVIQHGKFLPIHVDATKQASMVIPVQNHDSSVTSFYHCTNPSAGLVDPALCDPWCDIEIKKPTLIDVKKPHGVSLPKISNRQTTRISITVKWSDTTYANLISMLT